MTSRSMQEFTGPSVHNSPNISNSFSSRESMSLEETSLERSRSQRPRLGLPAVLGKRDLTLFMVLIVVFISNTNGIQFGGPVAFLYWTLGLLTFLVPCALVTQWLTHRYPGQGAPYLWVSRIVGSNWTFFSAFCIWLPGVLAVVSVIDNGLIYIHYLAPGWFNTPLQQCLGIIVILGLATGLACIPLRRLKHILGMLTILYLAIFALLGGIGIWWLMSGHASATSLSAPAGWQPNFNNFSIYGVIVLAFLGVDIPLFMIGEVRGGTASIRRASQYVWWGTAISFLAYMAGTFGIMVIVPASQAGTMTASVQAIQMVFGQQAGVCADIVIILSQVAITCAYILLFGRILILAAQDHRLPTSLTAVNRHGVPVLSLVVQATIVAGVTILSFVAVPALFGAIVRPEDLVVEIYNVMQAGTTVVWVCSIIQLFLYVLLLLYRRKYRSIISKERHPFQRRLLIGIALLGIGSSLVGVWDTIASSWIPALLPNERWTLLVCSVVLLSFLLGWFGSELPRMHALLGEQRRVNSREKALREELQDSYAEQQILVEQQQVLLSEVGRLYREQAKAAVTDAITGLPNHRAVMSRLEEEVSRCQDERSSCAVLFVDLDHFKRINDTWGHRAGDAILREVGARLRATLRIEDFVGRYGGEEFAIVLTDTDIGGARQTAERLRTAIASEPYIWMTEDAQTVTPIQMTGSIGVATYQLHGCTREELVEHADRAMYVAKHSGRNCVCIADVDMTSVQKREAAADAPSVQSVWQTVSVQTAQALAAAASAHDQETDDHAHRVITLAETTARKLEQPEEELQQLRLAALLHDIGKIGIPDAILHKPAPLDDEEWKVMRQHPEIGRGILVKTGGVFQHIVYIVVAHHERWDGHGYPNGLKGEAIPLGARILTVVDSFDAMTSRRSYREPMPIAHARAELERCAGSQFDPRVVKAFLSVLDEQEEQENSHEYKGMKLHA